MKALACEFTSVYAKLYKKAGLQIKLLSASSQISSSDAFMFFFLECGRCRAKARSLHEHKQETHLYKGKSSPLRRQIDFYWTQTKNTGQPNTTTRKSPSQTCVSPAETAKQTAKQQTKTKNGARAQTKTPTKSICHGTQWLVHCIIIKNVPMN